MDPIKEAFSKIKEDIFLLKSEISELREQLRETQTQNMPQPYQQTDNQTDNMPNYPDFTPKMESSIGNKGVPTNRQIYQQTHQQTQNNTQNQTKDPISEFKRANDILSSLDDIKKEVHLKFKGLTPQEMLVFSTLYGLEEQNMEQITYRTIAEQLTLSESSIREYINKLTKKGIPIEKIRQNNKIILLKISQDLKNVATLATIQTLRSL